MTRCVVAIILLAVLPGCALRHVSSDPDAERFSTAWETPRLKQQPVAVEFYTEGDCADERLLADAARILIDSGKFRPVRGGEKAAARIKLTVRVRRDTHALKVALNALIGYVWPIDAQDTMCEVFVVVEKPSGEVVGRAYAQGRGRAELWLGYLLWPRWIWNGEQRDIIHRDALKAVTVKACRALMPKARR